MVWLIEKKLIGYVIAVSSIVFLIIDIENAILILGMCVTILMLMGRGRGGTGGRIAGDLVMIPNEQRRNLGTIGKLELILI